MRTIEQVEALKAQLLAEGAPKPDIIRQLAMACIGWPYVFGAWGEPCTPANRKKRVRTDHPTIKTKCPALNGRTCHDCQWDGNVRMFDCRGFTAWLIRQTGLDIKGEGATSQYNTAGNWSRRGLIKDGMPDCVCCLFRKVGNKMEHTGMHVGGGTVIDCSVNVRSCGMSGWTHYAIPKGLYSEEEIPVTTVKPTLRKGAEGDLVLELQERLTNLGYGCGSIDGIFGKKTLAAVKAFQKDHSLEQDGVVGRLTWAWLEGMDPSPADAGATQQAGEPENEDQKYKVVCYGMTWEQVMEIRQTCPTATVEKE